jgi:PPOX class probable F420-dependent enzyme
MSIPKPKTNLLVRSSRVARLATVSLDGKPYIVPVVFVFDAYNNILFIPLDEKKKKSPRHEKLRRIKNIQTNPNVAILIDRYYEDWKKLYFVMIRGTATILIKDGQDNTTINRVHRMLYKKYRQYRKTGIGNACIMIKVEKIISWSNARE